MSAALLCLALSAGPAQAASDSGLDLSATVDGGTVGGGRLLLEPAEATRVTVTLRNLTSSNVEVGSVRLSGTVLGLTFFDYDTQVQTVVPALGSANWTVDLDTRGLASRATGLVPLDVAVRGADRENLETVSGTANIRGSLLSVYGLFGLGLVILAGLLLAVALLPLGRHAAPIPPWQRGIRFVPAGCGVGLVIVFGLSALRVMAPSTPTDFGFVTAGAVLAFGLAYVLSPPATAATAHQAGIGADHDWPRASAR